MVLANFGGGAISTAYLRVVQLSGVQSSVAGTGCGWDYLVGRVLFGGPSRPSQANVFALRQWLLHTA